MRWWIARVLRRMGPLGAVILIWMGVPTPDAVAMIPPPLPGEAATGPTTRPRDKRRRTR